MPLPLVEGDTLYVQSRDGKLYALKRPDRPIM